MPADSSLWVVASALAFGVAAIAYVAKSLTISGAIAAWIVGTVVFGVGGVPGSILLLTFFITGSALSRLPSRLQQSQTDLGNRDWKQVAANATAPVLGMLMVLLSPELALTCYAFFAGGLATATADTWATEIGTRYGGSPRGVLTLRRLSPGTSGGVTLLGTVAAIAGASLIGGLTNWLYPEIPVIAIAFAGFLGALVDSLLGDSLQTRFTCETCGARTEELLHCGTLTRRLTGIPYLDNSGVNLVTTLIGATMAQILT